MDNVLLVWTKGENQESAKSKIKAALKRNYMIDVTDELEFALDDEAGGRVAIEFEKRNTLVIKIKADYPWEAIAVYELVTSVFYSEDEE